MAWMNSSLGDCVSCGSPILVREGHETQKAGLAHRQCSPQDEVEEAAEALPAAVVARNLRSDWG